MKLCTQHLLSIYNVSGPVLHMWDIKHNRTQFLSTNSSRLEEKPNINKRKLFISVKTGIQVYTWGSGGRKEQ